jgi:hypothetical protein
MNTYYYNRCFDAHKSESESDPINKFVCPKKKYSQKVFRNLKMFRKILILTGIASTYLIVRTARLTPSSWRERSSG